MSGREREQSRRLRGFVRLPPRPRPYCLGTRPLPPTRKRGDVGVHRRAADAERFPFCSQEENSLMILLSRAGLRYNENAIAAGAQTEHRDGAGPERKLLAGGISPAL